ncbi:MAG: hypothetical protein GY874_17385 [Desulfobacteraceae bacterium]|nr:hypothetical protein [Desulfobacteraceae bacterium]
MTNRPTHKELFGKLVAARQAVGDGRIALLDQLSIAADAVELDYSLEHELTAICSYRAAK